MSIDFVPDPAAALAIQAAIQAKRRRVAAARFGGLKTSLTSSIEQVAATREVLDIHAARLIAVFQQLFAAAGCPLPPLPPTPSAPDTSSCVAAVDALASQVSDPLSFLSGVMTVTLDDDDYPTRIQVP